MAKRTVLYSSGGKKLYAVRSEDGQFEDIQSYQKAHSMDIKRSAKAEGKKKSKKKTAKKPAKKASKKKAAKKGKKKTTKKK